MSKKEKKKKIRSEYQQLQNKIFRRTALVGILAILGAYLFYIIFLQGRISNLIVSLMSRFLYKNYYTALDIYARTVRNNRELFVLLGVAVVFLVFFRLSLKNFTRYFNEINRGIDQLAQDDPDEIQLPSELAATEKKLNGIRLTLAQRKLEAELAEKRKNDLVMYLAHDLKTPLSSVIGYLTLLRDEQKISPELQQRYLSITLDKAQRLEDLINEFFDITRFNLSTIVLEYGKINLTRMLEQTLYEFKPMLAEKNLTCQLDIQQGIMLCCDGDKIQRVIDNLLRNAVNYSYADTNIQVAVAKVGASVHIAVTNEGNTIPREKLDKIFEQFFRLDTARSSVSGGAGLGLAIAREIVQLHGGAISATSQNGLTCFEISLPVGNL